MRSASAASTSMIILLLPVTAAAVVASAFSTAAFLVGPYVTRRRIPCRPITSSSCRPSTHLWMVDDGSASQEQQQQQSQRNPSKRQRKQKQGEKKRRFVQSVHPVRPATRAEDDDVESGGGGSFFRSNDSSAQGKRRIGANRRQEAQRGGVISKKNKRTMKQQQRQQRGGGGGGGRVGYQQQHDDYAVGDQRRRYDGDDNEKNDGEYNMDDPRKNPMLRHSSSIEELETIMMKRWGTKMDRWQADLDDGEWEIVEDDDNDDDEGGEEKDLSRRGRGGSSSTKKAKAAGGGIFRGRPVLDPWQEEDEDTGSVGSSAQQTPNKGVLTGSSNKKDVFGEDVVLDKVRRNQERMKKKREEKSRVTNKREGGGVSLVRKVEEEEQQKRQHGRGREDTPVSKSKQENDLNYDDEEEFYDEDDEGYEIKIDYFDDSNDDEITDEEDKDETGDVDDDLYNMQSLIAPKPVGGQGRNKAGAGGEDTSPPSSGFFFSPPPDKSTGAVGTSSPNTAKEEELGDGKNTKKEKKSVMIPTMLDENGNEMYLTVNQARSDLEKAISSTQTSTLFDEGDANNLPRLLSNPSTDTAATTTTTREWTDLGITTPQLLSNLQSMRCIQPLYVQDQTCPIVVSGNDVLVSTQTGSGKTLAFLVPLVERLLFNHNHEDEEGTEKKKTDGGVKVLILAPGRELASQIASVSRELLDNTGLTVQLAIGGTPYKRNLDLIRKKKPDILIGTPGRIAELVVGKVGDRSGRLKINSLQSIVLDEFDALLEYKPHREPTHAVVKALKKRHGNTLQSILCSATASDMLMNKGEEKEKKTETSSSSFLSDFVLRPGYAHVDVNEHDLLITPAGNGNENEGNDSSNSGNKETTGTTTTTTTTTTRVSRTVIHGTIHVPHKRLALETLRKILHTEPMPQQVLVFVDNSRRVGIVVDKLADMGIIAAPLHGGSNSIKTDRAEVSKALRDGFVGIVVATEMAARGIDAPFLTHVINLDLPTDSSHYAHRAGRCGRGGRAGVVINITTNGKERNVPRKFGDVLGVRMYNVEARSGKLRILEEEKEV